MTIARETRDVPGDRNVGVSKSIGSKELMVMISAIMALMALAIDLMLPAFDEIEQVFGLDPDSNQAAQTITVFFLGLAVAQVVWGPLADRYGRKPILYAGMSVYALGAVGSVFAPTFGALLASRFVWGVGAAGSRVVATAIIRDSFEGTRMAKAMSQIMAVFIMAPVFAPLLGAQLIDLFNWQSVFWFCVVWAGLIALWSTRLPETLRPEHKRPLQFRSITSGFATVARNRITSGYTLATLFLQATFTAYLGSSKKLIDVVFERPEQFEVIFGAVAILFGIGALVNGQVVGRYGMKRLIHVMLAMVLGMATLMLAVSLSTGGSPNFWLFMPMLGLLLSMFMFLMPNLNTSALAPMGAIAGTASSLTGAARIAGGAILAAFVDRQVVDSTTPFVVAILIFALGAAASVAWAERGEIAHTPAQA